MKIEIGIPERVRNKIIYLINLWSRPDPPVRVARTGPAGPSVGPPNHSAGGSGGRQGPAKKRRGEGSGRSVGGSERKLGSHQAVVPDNSEVRTSCRKVEDWLTSKIKLQG